MQPDIHDKGSVLRIARKEMTLFFASPVAWLFLAAFAAVTLFVFFWAEAFFARNIADVRPLFEWMPLLLIFLSATLTMRMWSEERRTGTLEHVLTRGLPIWHFVLGKFLACMSLLLIALIVTLPLPVSVALMGNLDWGPVLAGYLATLLLGAAYLSMGLFVSARTDNPIVSLIAATALCGVFYLLGSPLLTSFVGNDAAEWLRLLSTSARFESITRGVLDMRDLYFYLSLILVFLALNTLSLEQQRWARGAAGSRHGRWQVITLLVVMNALVGNLWLGQLTSLRVDMTAGKQYSISDATRQYLAQLREPLVLKGYFSAKTHPLLAPLVPQLRDLMKEYEIAGKGKVRVEFIDPQEDPQAEQEAGEKYGIKPVPLKMADRYQSSIVSSYFNLVVEYGDQHEVLGFQDLIEVQARAEGDIDVQLRNPEYDITRAIRKTLLAYQSSGNLFDTVTGNLTLTAYLSADNVLPHKLVEMRLAAQKIADEVAAGSAGRLQIKIENPQAGDGALAKHLAEQYGLKPMATSLFSDEKFYFYWLLGQGDQLVQIPLDDYSADSFRRNLDAGIKHFARGFTKTIGLVTPPEDMGAMYGMPASGKPTFDQLEESLGTDLSVVHEDLSDGSVAGNIDILMLAAPENLDDKQLFAVDQFLMKGGTVVLATSPYEAIFANRSLSVSQHKSGLEAWLKHNGLTLGNSLVMDTQNASFPLPVMRNVGGYQLQEIRTLDYPWFIDVRDDGLNPNSLVTSGLPQVTMAWASPVMVQADTGRTIVPLLSSSGRAWTSTSLDVMPRLDANGISPFTPSGQPGKQLLALSSSGRFDSFFTGKESPLIKAANEAAADTSAAKDSAAVDQTDKPPVNISSVIGHSPDSARIVLFASNNFLSDQLLQLAGNASQGQYLNSLQMVSNVVDWSLQDSGLLSIRSRSHFNRTLPPMEQETRLFWEYLNYGLALVALILIALVERRLRSARQARYRTLLAQ
jgi:ABC-2 type transport system permease protein